MFWKNKRLINNTLSNRTILETNHLEAILLKDPIIAGIILNLPILPLLLYQMIGGYVQYAWIFMKML
jgi:hypothetical protein